MATCKHQHSPKLKNVPPLCTPPPPPSHVPQFRFIRPKINGMKIMNIKCVPTWFPRAGWSASPHIALKANSIIRSRFTCAASPAPFDLVAFTLIVDDLVYWDGSTCMGQLGGGGSQTLFGFQAHRGGDASVALAAGVGTDLPASCVEWLQMNNIEMSGLVVHPDMPTPRAWQILEEDGRRHEIWRTYQSKEQANMLLPPLDSLPPSFLSSRASHLGVHPNHPPLSLLESLQQLDQHIDILKTQTGISDIPERLVSIETFTSADAPLTSTDLHQLLSLCSIFSPNEAEALSMLSNSSSSISRGSKVATKSLTKLSSNLSSEDIDKYPRSLTQRFIEAGAKLVAIRRGPKGAIIHDAASDRVWCIPAVPYTVVKDTTGCGNAFCGAFLAAIQAGEDAKTAGAWGCAAGSVMAEVRGVPQMPVEDLAGEVKRRAEGLITHMDALS